MDSLSKKKRNQVLAIVIACLCLAIMVAVSILRPADEDRDAAVFQETILAGNPRQMTAAEREDLRQQWRRFSPETREAIFTAVAQARLEEMRARTHDLTPEQRRERIRKAIAELREQRRRVSPEEQAEMRGRLSSEEGREMVKQVLSFYQKELTARERAELDPLVHEWLRQLDRELR